MERRADPVVSLQTGGRAMTDLIIRRAATFGGNGTLRFTLTREWDDRKPKVCFIGHNGATATHERDDPTCQRWMHFARSWGFGGFDAVNLYPIMTADPAEARRWADWEHNGPDWWVRDVLHENVEIVSRTAKAAGLVVACWGAIAQDDMWIDHVIESVVYGEEPWPPIHVFGLTKNGATIHPMARGKNRIPNDARPTLWKARS
jgi:hypothetical protein